MCRIGMIDLDRKTQSKVFPNLPLMKISAWHKLKGDTVEWYDGTHFDKVYVAKVFSFSPDYVGEIDADEIVYGGSGFCTEVVDGKEVYHIELDTPLPYHIEHIYPDYSLYGIKDTAYGFLSRGCPRNCEFCHVSQMQGRKPHQVAQLNEFWNGQKNIVLLDPNITSCKDWKEMFQELIDSKASVTFSQGIDIRALNDEKIDMLMQIKLRDIHIAWDRYEDGEIIKPLLKRFKEKTGLDKQRCTVYILCNFDTTFEQDLERAEYVRNMRLQPYIMIYNKPSVKRGNELNKLARWINWKPFCWSFDSFEEYRKVMYKC